MLNSNFWYYVFFAIAVIHIIAGFVYLAYKLSPKKEDDNNKKKDN